MQETDESNYYDEYVKTLNSSEERDEEYWDFWLKETKATFVRSRRSIKEKRHTIIELIKVEILVASVIFAGFKLVGDPQPTVLLLLPGVPFVVALALLIVEYLNLWPEWRGAGLDNVIYSLERGQSSKEAKQELAALYSRWEEDANSVAEGSNRKIFLSVILIFVGLGMATATLLSSL